MPIVALWSMKGGVGVSVLTAALAVSAQQSGLPSASSVIAVDLAGDLPVVFGMNPTETLGVVDWLRASPDDPAEAMRRLVVTPVDSGGFRGRDATAPPLGVMLRGAGPLGTAKTASTAEAASTTEAADMAKTADRFVAALRLAADLAIVDCGNFRRPGLFDDGDSAVGADEGFRVAVAGAADIGWLVTRACYLSASLASQSPVRPDGCAVLRESGRALASSDVSVALGVPLALEVAVDPKIARIVDCGSLLTRLPSSLQRTMVRSLRHVA